MKKENRRHECLDAAQGEQEHQLRAPLGASVVGGRGSHSACTMHALCGCLGELPEVPERWADSKKILRVTPHETQKYQPLPWFYDIQPDSVYLAPVVTSTHAHTHTHTQAPVHAHTTYPLSSHVLEEFNGQIAMVSKRLV